MTGNVILLAGARYTMVAQTAALELEPCPNILETSSTVHGDNVYAFYIPCAFGLEITNHSRSL